MIIAEWRTPGLFKADSQLVAEEIAEIGEEVTAKQIVDRARDVSAELHKCFDWNDTTAAEKYRIHQATILTSQLIIRRTEQEKQDGLPPIRVFHKAESSSGYKPIQVIVTHEDEYQKLLQRAYAELHAFKVKYSGLQELDYILSLID